jgi:tRNA A37 N6-isopentenylltransferase MiaA
VGPTAVGKTAVALALAELVPIEVVSADSRQIYRRLDIGTAKPTRRERRRVPHHGLDLVDPGQRYSAGRFALDGAEWVSDIRSRERLPVVVGGTGLYIRALAEGLPGAGASRDAARRSPGLADRCRGPNWCGGRRDSTRFRGGGKARGARHRARAAHRSPAHALAARGARRGHH